MSDKKCSECFYELCAQSARTTCEYWKPTYKALQEKLNIASEINRSLANHNANITQEITALKEQIQRMKGCSNCRKCNRGDINKFGGMCITTSSRCEWEWSK